MSRTGQKQLCSCGVIQKKSNEYVGLEVLLRKVPGVARIAVSVEPPLSSQPQGTQESEKIKYPGDVGQDLSL